MEPLPHAILFGKDPYMPIQKKELVVTDVRAYYWAISRRERKASREIFEAAIQQNRNRHAGAANVITVITKDFV